MRLHPQFFPPVSETGEVINILTNMVEADIDTSALPNENRVTAPLVIDPKVRSGVLP